MTSDKGSALHAGVAGAAIQLLAQIPGISALIEGVRTYHEHIEDQQRREFLAAICKRQDELNRQIDWLRTTEGRAFVKKIVATALNAEYSDKLEFLANALVNGPSLRDDDARRTKFVELIRQLSRPALEVLVASVRLTGDGDIIVDKIAEYLQWHPELVEACVRELHSLGAYSHILRWQNRDGRYHAMDSLMNESPGVAPITRAFADFIQEAGTGPPP